MNRTSGEIDNSILCLTCFRLAPDETNHKNKLLYFHVSRHLASCFMMLNYDENDGQDDECIMMRVRKFDKQGSQC